MKKYLPNQQGNLAVILVLLVVFAILGVGILLYFISPRKPAEPTKIQSVPSSTIIPISTQSTTSTVPTDWKTYNNADYSIQYPPNWVSNDGRTSDPNSMQPVTNNGDRQISAPSRFVDIYPTFTNDLIETPQQYADKLLEDPAYINGIKVSPISINNTPGVMHQASGEGSKGWYIVLSNGNELYTINIPDSYPTSDETINQILATFKFTK